MVNGYKDLDLWKKAYAIVLDVYKVTNVFPRNEQFGVVSQVRRAACSIPANIAEGFGRRSTKELLQFLSVSNGSLEELRFFLLLSRDLRYLSPVEHQDLEARLKAIAQMTEALSQSLRRKLNAAAAAPKSMASPRVTGHGSRNAKPPDEAAN